GKCAGGDGHVRAGDRALVLRRTLQGTPPSTDYYAPLRNMPFADEVLLAFAIEAMNQHHLGQHPSPDIFSVGFSATDTIGHRYGPDSQEILDQLLRLDQVLNQLFQYIDRSVGLANTVVIATADHGATPLIEALEAK